MMVAEIAGLQLFEVTFVERNDVIQTVAPDAADHTFHSRIPPGAAQYSEHLFDTQAFDSLLKLASTPVRNPVSRQAVSSPKLRTHATL
jgi:hypothetical protein